MTADRPRRVLRCVSTVLIVFLAVASRAGATGDAPDSAGSAGAAEGQIKLSERLEIDASAATVWRVVGAFNGLSLWQPDVVSSRVTRGKNNTPGAERHVVLADGGSVNEELVAWNGERMRYTYRILQGALPVTHYESTIAVERMGDDRSALIWEGAFDADADHSDAEARRAIQAVYRAGLKNVETMVGAD